MKDEEVKVLKRKIGKLSSEVGLEMLFTPEVS